MKQADEHQPSEKGGPGLIKVFWAFLLLLVLYVGSIGPVVKVYGNGRAASSVHRFYMPLQFCYEHSPIAKRFFDWYLHVWGTH